MAAATFFVSFLIAGVWVAGVMDGYHLDPAGAGASASGNVYVIEDGWLDNYRTHALLWAAPASALAFAVLTGLLLRTGRAGAAFLSSSLTQAATILTSGLAVSRGV